MYVIFVEYECIQMWMRNSWYPRSFQKSSLHWTSLCMRKTVQTLLPWLLSTLNGCWESVVCAGLCSSYSPSSFRTGSLDGETRSCLKWYRCCSINSLPFNPMPQLTCNTSVSETIKLKQRWVLLTSSGERCLVHKYLGMGIRSRVRQRCRKTKITPLTCRFILLETKT